ncbi:MAG TPA: hypothetical protein VMY18_07150 [Acidobacteriota bacterium]|nr:hypothetical protein [Acidobacteriota bacterium]
MSVMQPVILNSLGSWVRNTILARRPNRIFAAATELLLLVICLVWTGVPLAAQSSEAVGQETEASEGFQRSWLGPDGNLLPFKNDSEILEFMRTAEVVKTKTISDGVTKPEKVLLEKDGVQMNAVFRDVDVFKRKWKSADGLKLNFRDSCFFEIAAYEMALLLGLDSVPPVLKRKIKGKDGSLQAWVEEAMTEKSRKKNDVTPPTPRFWMLQYQIMYLFDNLLFNDDRNTGNILIDRDWGLWLIDHTRAFRPVSELKNASSIILCERGVWEKLKNLEDSVIEERLGEYLDTYEMKTLLARKQKMIEHVEELFVKRGQDSVLFDLEQ